MRRLPLTLLLIALAACQTQAPKDGMAIDAMKQALAEGSTDAGTRRAAPPPEVAASLMPAMNIQLGGSDAAARSAASTSM